MQSDAILEDSRVCCSSLSFSEYHISMKSTNIPTRLGPSVVRISLHILYRLSDTWYGVSRLSRSFAGSTSPSQDILRSWVTTLETFMPVFFASAVGVIGPLASAMRSSIFLCISGRRSILAW